MPISVIIPTFNEEACLQQTIASLREQNPCEIIVVDGGSTDETLSKARAADRVLQTEKGRASQMNAGAQVANGDKLLFLHADCRLETRAMAEMDRLLDRETIIAGCFRMHVDADGMLFRLIDAAATARVRWTGIAYGDQGLFMTKSRFDASGGFPALSFMEDLFFSQRLRKLGRIIVTRSKIHVSPRRWQRKGLIRQTIRNWTLTGLAASGVHPDSLCRYYPTIR